MAAVRHILKTNTWEMQCPVCSRMVPIDRAIFTGEQPFRAHSRWSISWSQSMFDRCGMVLRERVFVLVQMLISFEARVRVWTARWEPKCAYRKTVTWNQEIWPASGIDSYGPTA